MVLLATTAARNAPVGAKDLTGNTACYDLPGSRITCGSHCWPNCDGHVGGGHPDSPDFNHYIVIPEARSCYIDTIDYGRFDAFLPKNSKLNLTIDTYVIQNGVCVLNESGAITDPGAIQGDKYCQIFIQVDMGECDGCPERQRRLEVYSNRDTGCGLEFYVEPVVIVDPEPEPEPQPPTPVDPEPEETEEEEEEETTTPPAPSPEVDGSYLMGINSLLVVLSAVLMN